MSTRPRIEFDDKGWCNACVWSEEKKLIDWKKRKEIFFNMANKSKTNKNYDCIVPLSGGKDGTYVSFKMKELGLNPLTVTIRPHMEKDLGIKNLNSFLSKSNLAHVHITIPYEALRKINRLGLVEKGSPYYGWLIAMHTAVIRLACDFNIGLIMWGEDGELEYGGTTKNKNKFTYDLDYIKNEMIEGDYEKIIKASNLNDKELFFLKFPTKDEIKERKILFSRWGYFENWDSYRNYIFAKNNANLQEETIGNEGTFTNFAQNDQILFQLHTYLMYLKFGFGRATQDAGIEIRRGAMVRTQALNLVKLYDNSYPERFIDQYLEYYKMSKKEFNEVLEKWTNKDLFEKRGDKWIPKFEVV
tara:strand:- start:9356 stop:10429 length:1074 start_codon:yes stop_codon:yes gene_type:complete